MRNAADKAEHEVLPVMRLRGELFVPHYSEKNIMVARGGIMMHWDDLKRAGAVANVLPLWSRVWLKEITS